MGKKKVTGGVTGFGTGGGSAISAIAPKPDSPEGNVAPSSQRTQGKYLRRGTKFYQGGSKAVLDRLDKKAQDDINRGRK